MNTDAVSAAVIASRPAWRSLTWTVPFTALWTWLIYSLPVLPESGVPAVAVRLMAHGLMALGLWLALENTKLTPTQRQTTWLVFMVPLRFGPPSPGRQLSTAYSARMSPLYRCFRRRSCCP